MMGRKVTVLHRIVFKADIEAKTQMISRSMESSGKCWERHILGRENSKYSGPKLGISLGYLRKIISSE